MLVLDGVLALAPSTLDTNDPGKGNTHTHYMMELDVMRARGGNPILCYWSPMVQSITTAVKSEKNLYISTLQVRKPFIKIMLNISYVSLSLPKKKYIWSNLLCWPCQSVWVLNVPIGFGDERPLYRAHLPNGGHDYMYCNMRKPSNNIWWMVP